ncbi:Dabb family protein [Chitinophaga nivalis]|uniref:Dabb family protein n=1 Tax=Chitinophaga nivalis TaxID=2991709 RepID=A0ABT3IRD6_9BACT|nr:Dabb family protein [Chitinophaga nivalis]MCW3463786.1 Dabb family protein [Chitinophaga nivalis]MCW3486524.1 Dabb family protein [Chitinophaga nivalis]
MKKTNRRKFIGTAAALCAATAAAAVPLPAITVNRTMVHHVFFWLRNPTATADRDQLIAGLQTLGDIDTVKALHIGIVADTAPRDVVDNTWSVSELIFFDDVAGQATYQTHPIHLAFIEKYSHLWNKVVVYDAQTIQKQL